MNARIIIGFVFILLGVSALTGMDLGRYIGPAFLIAIGIMILSRQGTKSRKISAGSMSQDSLNEVFVFSGSNKQVKSQNFSGGKITAVFSGAEFDLTEVKTGQKQIPLEVAAVFGGVKLIVPKDWKVISEAVGIVGGVDNRADSEKAAVELHVSGAAVFGGIEIAN
jgi:hypothetical protein